MPISFTRDERGLAAIEVALLVPVLAALLYVLVEGGNTIRTYSALTEASRSAARHVVLTGETDNLDAFVRSLVTSLDPQALSTNVSAAEQGAMVTVQVRYGYKSVFTSNIITGEANEPLYTLTAQTSMPLP
ncbi:TadE family protein [Oleidesulfovibrio alaskensis G20]|jgi:Flp pilus assembly protein TadG|uniref:TadE family protein n=1 Tax=Oleidesulfovibrio alaskensis (strain ATCC BAA-1058 / DSM 17464 / G20) TaxID=207559 RepID=Q30YT2_OLEA2|nr:TadE/TadG family type IV pilus assembly protein [Oleidesulfovibrio alaskensis]ABB39164.1 TadE family protein [Oleidesulfovibrio alaskensis G20]MBG0772075.1 pilus assembly protein [Oleidesulfovibrio alaskensis]MBL3581687.1 pilus assembly protein [Oleidesulfovibrio alaskensis]